MHVKRLAAVLVVFLILGLTISSVVASAELASVGILQSESKRTCSAGDAQSFGDLEANLTAKGVLKVYEGHSSSAVLMATALLQSMSRSDIAAVLEDKHFDLGQTRVRYVSINGTETYEVLKVPIVNKEGEIVGLVGHVRSSHYEGTFIGIYNMDNGSVSIVKLQDGNIVEVNSYSLKDSQVSISGSCLESILGCLFSLASLETSIAQCPLCVQVVTCIPACASIFGTLWCLLCIGTGALGCFNCAAVVWGIYSCAKAAQCVGR